MEFIPGESCGSNHVVACAVGHDDADTAIRQAHTTLLCLLCEVFQVQTVEVDASELGRDRLVVDPQGIAVRQPCADEFPDAVYLNNLERYANSISSTIPTVLAHLDEVLAEQGQPPAQKGDLIVLPAAGICMTSKPTNLAQGWAVLEW